MVENSFDNPALHKNDIRVPEKTDLYDALEKILWFWPTIYIHSYQLDPQAKNEFNLIRAVKLTGQYQGLVIIQSFQDLGDLLARSLLDDRPSSGQDAFNEFTNMFCGHIMNKIRASENVAFRHFLPFPISQPEWPTRQPDAKMTVAIQSIPVDVQLWIDPVSSAVEKRG
jgi:hypothetical protein